MFSINKLQKKLLTNAYTSDFKDKKKKTFILRFISRIKY